MCWGFNFSFLKCELGPREKSGSRSKNFKLEKLIGTPEDFPQSSENAETNLIKVFFCTLWSTHFTIACVTSILISPAKDRLLKIV